MHRELGADYVQYLAFTRSHDSAPTGAPQPPIEEITVTYDKFEDVVIVLPPWARSPMGEANFPPVMTTRYSGKARPAELHNEVILGIGRFGIGQQFRDRHEIPIVCGDDRLEHTDDRYSSDQNGAFWWDEYLILLR